MKLADLPVGQQDVARKMLIVVGIFGRFRGKKTFAFAGAAGSLHCTSELTATFDPDDFAGSALFSVVRNERQGNPLAGIKQIERSFQIKHIANMLRERVGEKDSD